MSKFIKDDESVSARLHNILVESWRYPVWPIVLLRECKEEIDKLKAENEELKAKFPKTADGSYKWINDVVWHKRNGVLYSCGVGQYEQAAICLCPSGMDQWIVSIQQCYSTSEAAEQAAREAGRR